MKKYSYPRWGIEKGRNFIKSRKYQLLRHSNLLLPLYSRIWSLITNQIDQSLNVVLPFWKSFPWKKIFRTSEPGTFFLWTYDSNATRKTGTLFCCNLLRVNPYFYWTTYNCDALRDLVPFAQFKRREKHPWRSVDFSKVAGWSLPHGCFSRFLNCANGTKSRDSPQLKLCDVRRSKKKRQHF